VWDEVQRATAILLRDRDQRRERALGCHDKHVELARGGEHLVRAEEITALGGSVARDDQCGLLGGVVRRRRRQRACDRYGLELLVREHTAAHPVAQDDRQRRDGEGQQQHERYDKSAKRASDGDEEILHAQSVLATQTSDIGNKMEPAVTNC
jgi:hypothetical protein